MRCPSCTEAGTLTCGGCRNVMYCSLACQQTDWQFHKALCKTFKDFQQRPSPEMRRVIFFSDTVAEPQFRWLAVKDIGDEDSGSVETVDSEQLMGVECFIYSNECTRNTLIGATLDTAIALCFDEQFLLRFASANPAVLTATNKKVGNVWRGPMLAYCGERAYGGHEIVKVKDMDMNCFSDLVAYLIDYHSNEEFHSDGELCTNRKGPKIPGVRTNCVGEQRSKHAAPFAQSDMIPRMHPIFDEGEVSGISRMIGLPLLFWKHSKKTYPKVPREPTGHCNEKVTFMMLSCDPSSSRFGWAPLHWTGGRVPNVLVARLDRQPLNVDTFQAFADFCRYRMQPFFEWSCEIEGRHTAKHTEAKILVMQEMTPARWSDYWSEWRIRHVDATSGGGASEEQKKTLHSRLWDENSQPRLSSDVRRRI